jgi:hypothetical protein
MRSHPLRNPFPASWDAPVRAGLAAVLLAGITVLPAAAQTDRSSSAYGEKVTLQLVPLLGNLPLINSGPLPAVAGSTAPAYAETAHLAKTDLTTPLTGNVLTAAAVEVNAAGAPGPLGDATADATLTNPGLRVVGALPLLALASDEIRSSARVSGLCSGTFNAAGESHLVNARLSGIVGNIPIPLNPAPNTVLLNLLGIKIVLNEQIVESRQDRMTLTVNAIHITLSGAVTALGVATGDIVLAQSRVETECELNG